MGYQEANMSKLRTDQRGFSLGELLVVVAIIGLVVMVAVPLIAEQVRAAEVRAAGDQLAMSLKAARMVAVTTHADVVFTIDVDPDNKYSYTDNKGRLREIEVPESVTITSSDGDITFEQNGSIDSVTAMDVVLEANMTGGDLDRWTISTSILGVASVTHDRYTP
jgi:prepilin-type N-terminal cleavage/methylation domain-containing protein